MNRKNIKEIVEAGRTRWKIENENNNTLKTKGYNFKHNFGHGKQHLSSLLASLNILAFLVHTVLEWFDQCYALVRNELASRKTFFDDIRALTLDHVLNNGAEERKKLSPRGVYRRSLNPKNKKEYQILCMNCQFIKRVEDNRENQHI